MPVTSHPVPRDVQEFVERLALTAQTDHRFARRIGNLALNIYAAYDSEYRKQKIEEFVQLLMSAGLPSESEQ